MGLCESDDPSRSQWCRNTAASTHLKWVSIGVILVASMAGIASPVALARLFEGKAAYGRALLLIKCFAAGVIMSTALVHVLPEAFEALADCQLRHPWRDFPFSGLVALAGSLLALLVDVTATSHATKSGEAHHHHGPQSYEPIGLDQKRKPSAVAVVEMSGGGCHGSGDGAEGEGIGGDLEEDEEERLARVKQRMVSQVLEIGIVFHSVIIGVTMGMSQNQCTIRPLVAALAFHQVFEGMGLGGCIAQAGFGLTTVGYMCIMFAVTTPVGIVLGMMVFYLTGYDDSNPHALIMEGLLGSLSSGILVYMALVDLIAADFFHNKTMTSNPRLKKASFIALVLGSASMSVLAIWA